MIYEKNLSPLSPECVCVCDNSSYAQSDPLQVDGNAVDTALFIGTTNALALPF